MKFEIGDKEVTNEIINKIAEHDISLSDFVVDDNGSTTYRGIQITTHNDRYLVVSNKDLLDLGICTHNTLSNGHNGYKSFATLIKRIDKGLGD